MRWSYLAIAVLGVLAVQSFAANVAVTNTHLQTKYGTLANVYFETASGPGSSTPGTNTALTPPGSSGSYFIASGTSGYLWSPQFASSTSTSAGNWVFNFWAAASAYSYVQVTLSNSQSAATPNPFQAMVTWNPSTYAAYEASNLGNIRFCLDTGCVTMLYAWLESCTSSCTTGATSASAWVKLTSTIAANGGTLIIYMVFLSEAATFDGNYWGEAPTLSGTYGQYDNGANVFSLYFNGNTPVSSFVAYSGYTVSQATGVAYGSGTASVIKVTGSATTNDAQFAFNTGVSNVGYVEEVSWESETANNKGFLGLADSTNLGSIQNAIGVSAAGGFTGEYITGGTVTSGTTVTGTYSQGAWLYGTMVYAGPASMSYSAAASSSLYPGSLTTINGHPLGSAGTLYFAPMSHHTGTSAATYYYDWGRLRAYPPGGVPPTVSFGSVSPNTASVSIYITGSTGTVTATVASGVQSPALGTAEALITMTFAGAQETIPASGYISVVFAASSGTTVYWGTGQLTDFQVPVQVLT